LLFKNTVSTVNQTKFFSHSVPELSAGRH